MVVLDNWVFLLSCMLFMFPSMMLVSLICGLMSGELYVDRLKSGAHIDSEETRNNKKKTLHEVLQFLNKSRPLNFYWFLPV